MIELLNTLTHFDGIALKNIPIINQNAFDDLSDAKEDWSLAESMVHHKTSFIYQQINEDAIEFIFNQTEWQPSRFGDGSFPVWYGALELETTFSETAFHWQQLLIDAGYLNSSHVMTCFRRVFKVGCTSHLIDIRSKTNKYPFLIQKDRKNYQETQKLGSTIAKEGFPGLLTRSARFLSGTNLVIFNKKSLHHPAYFNDYRYEIKLDSHHPLQVFNEKTGKLVFSE